MCAGVCACVVSVRVGVAVSHVCNTVCVYVHDVFHLPSPRCPRWQRQHKHAYLDGLRLLLWMVRPGAQPGAYLGGNAGMCKNKNSYAGVQKSRIPAEEAKRVSRRENAQIRVSRRDNAEIRVSRRTYPGARSFPQSCAEIRSKRAAASHLRKLARAGAAGVGTHTHTHTHTHSLTHSLTHTHLITLALITNVNGLNDHDPTRRHVHRPV